MLKNDQFGLPNDHYFDQYSYLNTDNTQFTYTTTKDQILIAKINNKIDNDPVKIQLVI